MENNNLWIGSVIRTTYKSSIGLEYHHYGIYDGWGKVTHFASLNGQSEKRIITTSLEDFAYNSVNNNKNIIEVLAFEKDRVVNISLNSSRSRARSKLGNYHYELFTNNCEHFALWCRTGCAYSTQAGNISDYYSSSCEEIESPYQQQTSTGRFFSTESKERELKFGITGTRDLDISEQFTDLGDSSHTYEFSHFTLETENHRGLVKSIKDICLKHDLEMEDEFNHHIDNDGFLIIENFRFKSPELKDFLSDLYEIINEMTTFDFFYLINCDVEYSCLMDCENI